MTVRLSIVFSIILSVIGLTNAQAPIDLQPILSTYHNIRIDIPNDWNNIVFENDGVILSRTDNVIMVIYLTQPLRRQGYTATAPAELNQQYARNNSFTDTLPEIIETNDDLFFTTRHNDGIILSTRYGTEDLLLVDVRTDDVDAILDILLAMLDTLGPYSSDITIENYTGDWRTITTELLTKGYIRGGTLVQRMPAIEFSGSGESYQPLAKFDVARDIAVGATIQLQSGTDDVYETCGIMSRVVSDQNDDVSLFLEAGIDSDGDAYLFDRYGLEPSDVTLNFASVDMPRDEVYLFYKVEGGIANVFINGQRVLKDLLIQEREGHFGLAFVGATDTSTCIISDIWTYQLNVECTILINEDRETYFSPIETEFALGEVIADEYYETDAFYLDDDLNEWWRIAVDARWMRGDGVALQGACESVSFVTDLSDPN